MKKIMISFVLSLILILSLSLTSASVDLQEECKDADQIIPVSLHVTGKGCTNKNNYFDSTIINIDKSGHYLVFGISERGNPNQCQEFEDFYIEFNGERGDTSRDDKDACAISTRTDEIGDFILTQGEEEITMFSDAVCPPDTSANSVKLTHICLYKNNYELPEEPEIACHQDTDCGETRFIGKKFCSDDDIFRNYKKSTCNNPGTIESFCTISTEPKILNNCPQTCSEGQCIPFPELLLNIINPENKIYDIFEIPIEIESNAPFVFYAVDNPDNKIEYNSPLTISLSQGVHTIFAFAKDATRELTDSVMFQIEIKEDNNIDNDGRRKQIYIPDEYFNGTGLAESTIPVTKLIGIYTNPTTTTEILELSTYIPKSKPSLSSLDITKALMFITSFLLLLFLLIILLVAVKNK
jgi:hypothetical protein